MEVLLIRHAIAELRLEEGGTQADDRLRELTSRGRRRMKRSARGLKRIQPEIAVLATSPLVRATQTAQIVAPLYDVAVTTVAELAPGAGPDAVIEWLRGNDSRGTVALVGHEPDLSELAARLLTAAEHPLLSLKKGGACRMQVSTGAAPGGARLDWLLTPGQLRRMAR